MKKKIIIFTSSGGGGHVAAAHALEQYLGNEYEVITHYPFSSILKKLDPIYWLSFGYLNSESGYNVFITGKWYNILNAVYYIGKPYINLLEKQITQAIYNYLLTQKADIVISVMPFINNACVLAAQQLNIPFLLFPLDLDATHFVYNIKNATYKNFYIGLPFNSSLSKKTLVSADILDTQFFISGALLRADFFSPKNTESLKEQYNIPNDKPVLLLLMGSAGSHATQTYFEQLLDVTIPLHIIIVLGRNKSLRPTLEVIELPKHISVTIFGFTHDMANLMALSDLCVMKSGSVSVCEATYSNLPMLLDAVGPVLKWEQLNHIYIEKYNLGKSITDYNQVGEIVESLLKNNTLLAQMKQNFTKIEKKNTNTGILQFIKKILNKKGPAL